MTEGLGPSVLQRPFSTSARIRWFSNDRRSRTHSVAETLFRIFQDQVHGAMAPNNREVQESSSVRHRFSWTYVRIRWVKGLWEQGGLRVFSGGTDPLKHGPLRTGRFDSLRWWQRSSSTFARIRWVTGPWKLGGLRSSVMAEILFNIC